VNKESHQVLGAVSGVTLGHLASWQLPQSIVAGVVASVTAAGILSPDCDQYNAWKRWFRWVWRLFGYAVAALPIWPSGRSGDPTQHRGITHWWGVPALWSLAVLALERAVPGPFWWLAWTGIVGWTSHLLGDAVHGRQFHGQDGHGVPLAPWWKHVGAGVTWRGEAKALKSSGWTERWVTVPVVAVAGLVQVAAMAAALR
jgi:membrane-bound metal-dependent hydrolase YbcI (DUF457 family)